MDRSNDSDALEGIVEIFRRSFKAKATPKTLYLRLHNHLVRNECFDMPELEERITELIEHERRTKGKQQPSPLNAPPARLQREFESIRRVGSTKGKKAPEHAPVQLQGPVEKYGPQDLTEGETLALVRFMQLGAKAASATSPKTTNLLGTGGGSRPRGGVRDSQRAAFSEFIALRTRFPDTWWEKLDRLVEGRVTAVEIGKWLVPSLKKDESHRAIGRGWIKMLAQQLEYLERMERGALRGPNIARLETQAKRERRRVA